LVQQQPVPALPAFSGPIVWSSILICFLFYH